MRNTICIKLPADLNRRLEALGGRALISVNKALVTQASSAIPVVPLYISLLYKVMKKQGLHEGCIEQADRLFREQLYSSLGPVLNAESYIRLDDWEMKPEVQEDVARLWKTVNTENLHELADLKGYQEDFYHLFGFSFPGIDYEAECEPEVSIPSISRVQGFFKEKHIKLGKGILSYCHRELKLRS